MARRSGVTRIISNNQKVLSVREKGMLWQGWVGDKRLDIKDNGSISNIWKGVLTQQETPTSVIEKLDKAGYIKLHTIRAFVINGNFLKVKDIFHTKSKTYCVFICNPKDKTPVWRLGTIGCKTAKEIRLAGYNYKKDSYLPLIIEVKILSDVGKKEFVFLNSI